MQTSEALILSAASVLRRSDRTAWQTFDTELVVLDVPTRTLLGLNELGGWIWDRLDGEQSLGDLALAMATAYGKPIETVRNDVVRFAQSLLDRGCVEPLPTHDANA